MKLYIPKFTFSKACAALITAIIACFAVNSFASGNYLSSTNEMQIEHKNKIINAINNDFYEYRINRQLLVDLEYLRIHQKNLSNSAIEKQKHKYVERRNYYHDRLYAEIVSVRHYLNPRQYNQATEYMRWDDSYAMKTIDYLPNDDEYKLKQSELIKCLTFSEMCTVSLK